MQRLAAFSLLIVISASAFAGGPATSAEQQVQPKISQSGGMALSLDGATLATGSYKKLYLYDTATGAQTGLVKLESGGTVGALAFLHRDRRVAFVAGQTLGVYDAGADKLTVQLEREDRGNVLAATPDGATVLVGSKEIDAYDTATGERRFSVPLEDATRVLAVSPDGTRFAIVPQFKKRIDVFSTADGGPVASIKTPDVTHAVAFLDADTLVAVSGFDLIRADVEGDVTRAMRVDSPFGKLVASPDGRQLAIGTWDSAEGETNRITIYRSSDLKELTAFAGLGGAVRDVCYSADGRHIAAHIDRDPIVHIWPAPESP